MEHSPCHHHFSPVLLHHVHRRPVAACCRFALYLCTYSVVDAPPRSQMGCINTAIKWFIISAQTNRRYADMDVIGRESAGALSVREPEDHSRTADQATHDLHTPVPSLPSVEHEQLGRFFGPWLPLLLAWARKHLPTLRHAGLISPPTPATQYVP